VVAWLTGCQISQVDVAFATGMILGANRYFVTAATADSLSAAGESGVSGRIS
jgi:hypothetical protein